MSRIIKLIHYLWHLFVRMMILGNKRQSFLDAFWIRIVLKLTPGRFKRSLALRVLNLSPHYFYKETCEDYQNISFSNYLDREYQRNKESRKKILDQILKPYLKGVRTAMDYGCGPGFLAKHVSSVVERVFAVDMSRGVLECAKIINASSKISYLHTDQMERAVREENVDLIYSFAVIQHVTNDIFVEILRFFRRKLAVNGTLVVHIPLDETGWKTESEHRDAAGSGSGKRQWKYELNCFRRTKEDVKDLLEREGYQKIQIVDVKDLCQENFNDICRQHLVIASKTDS